MISPYDIAISYADASAQRGRTGFDIFSPHKPWPKQKAVFDDETTRETLYGGQAGGGKSDLMLMRALKYTHIPGYAALILRRTFSQLNKAGSLISRAHEWLRPNSLCLWSEKKQAYTFRCPGGGVSTIEFGHMQHETDKYNYQGPEYQFICFDELTQFTETQYNYLLSRLRRVVGLDVPVQVLCTSNPGGAGHKWVKEYFVDESTRGGRKFVSASLDDNPSLDADDYRLSLKGLDKTTRDQLEKGLWIEDTEGLVYSFTRHLNLIERLPDGIAA